MHFKQLLANMGIEDDSFTVGKDTFYKEEDGTLFVTHHSGENQMEYQLRNIGELYEGSEYFDFQDDSWNDKYLPLLLSIETVIVDYFRKHPRIKDRTVISVLEPLSKNPETKYIHEGKYVAEVDVELVINEEEWSPYLTLEDAYKLDNVRAALR